MCSGYGTEDVGSIGQHAQLDPGDEMDPENERPSPREKFEQQFGSITDDQWQWLKEFTAENYQPLHKTYEYTSGYLLEVNAKDINRVTEMMNQHGEFGWHFTGYAKEVQNGTFYMFARLK